MGQTRSFVQTVLIAMVVLASPVSSIEAASLKGILRQLAEMTAKEAKHGDDAVRGVLKRLAENEDEMLAQIAKELNPRPVTSAELMAALAKVGMKSTDEVQDFIKNLDETSRSALAALIRESDDLLTRAAKTGLAGNEVLEAIDKAGPSALLACRQMQSEDGLKAVVRGTREFGSDFVTFVRKADEPAVRTLMKDENLEMIRRAWNDPKLKADVEDVFKNPTKYFDKVGKPTKAWDELIERLRRPGGIGQKAYDGMRAVSRTRAWQVLAAVVATGLSTIKWAIPVALEGAVAFATTVFVTTLLVLLLIVAIVSTLAPLVINFLLGVIARSNRRIGEWARDKLEDRKARSQTRDSLGKVRDPDVLRIGLLGVQRVGKTTFTVMLWKHLSKAVPGASVSPYRDAPDALTLKEMASEISSCAKTKQERRVALNLTWPFNWSEDHTGAAGVGAELASGKLNKRLELVDYPGEWATTAEDRARLKDRLREVDGLFVVIDPSDLETEGPEERLKLQREVLQNMFAADRLDLGRSFSRSLCILITKRDALTPAVLQSLAQQNGVEADEASNEMVTLSQKPALTVDESRRLGEWLLRLLFPGLLEEVKLKLTETFAPRRPWWQRWIPFFGVKTRPQATVYAVSLLGQELGREVVAHRRRVQEWERAGKLGPQPTISLNLEHVKPEGFELQHPFRWMFNSIPHGWLHQVKQVPADFRYRLPALWRWFSLKGRMLRHTLRRFAGAPLIEQERKALRWRAGVGYSLTLVILVIVAILMTFNQSQLELAEYGELLKQATSAIEQAKSPTDVERGNHELEQFGQETKVRDFTQEIKLALQYLAVGKKNVEVGAQLQRTGDVTELLGSISDLTQSLVRLPTVPAGYHPQMEKLREAVKRQANDLFLAFLQKVRQIASEHVGKGDYTAAYKLVDTVEPIFSHSTDFIQLTGELSRIREAIGDKDAEFWVNDARSRAEGQAKEEKYDEAIAILKAVSWPMQMTPEKQRELQDIIDGQKNTYAELFWNQVRAEVNNALSEANLDSARQILNNARKTLDWDIWPDRIRQLDMQLADQLVRGTLEKVPALLEKTPDQARDELRKIRPYVSAAQPETQKQFTSTYVRVLLVLKSWLEAASELDRLAGPERPDDWGDLWSRAWQGWQKDFNDRLAATSPDVRQLEQELRMAEQYGVRLPEETQKKLPEFRSVLNRRYVAARLDEVASRLAENKTTEAEEILRDVEPRLQSLQEDWQKVELKRWIDLNVQVFERTKRAKEGALWLEKLSDAFKQAFPEWPSQRDRLVEIACTDFTSRWTEFFSDNPQQAFDDLYSEAHNQASPEGYLAKIGRFAQEQVRQYLGQLGVNIEQCLQGKQYVAAKARIEEANRTLGRWCAYPEYGNTIAELTNEVARASIDSELVDVSGTITNPSANYEQIHQRLTEILRSPEITDDQRGRVNGLIDDVLARWENRDWEGLKKARVAHDFEQLAVLLQKYTDDGTAYSKKISDQRRQQAENLHNWLRRFDKLNSYQIVEIEYFGVPASINPIDPRFDLTFKVTIAKQSNVITPKGNSVYGKGAIGLDEAVKLSWSKGQPVMIEVWDDEPGKEDHFIGKVDLTTDDYGLVRILSTPVKVDWSDGNYEDYNWDNFQIRLVAADWVDPPTLNAR